MKYRAVGKTDFSASALGFGCMRFPLLEAGNDKSVDEAEAVRILRFAIDSGVNYIDTAYGYHGGTSELIVGKALKDGYREKVSLATKLPLWNLSCTEDFDRLLSEQLSKLQTDHIDFYLLHAVNNESWETKVKPFGIIEKMLEAREKGLIRHIGFSFHDDLGVFKKVIDECDAFEFCQIQLNYIDVDTQAGLEGLEYAAAKGLGVIVMEPLLGGKLANPKKNVEELIDDKKSPVEWALDFLWNRPEVSLILSGMGSMQMVRDNLAYADKAAVGMLTGQDLDMLAGVKKEFDSLTVVPCTGCEYCMPCPSGVMIPKVFAAYNEIASGGRRRVKELFPDIEVNASLCKKCGKCESKCPQQIKIIDSLKMIVDKF